MDQTISRIQLIAAPNTVPSTNVLGYLDVSDSVNVPITYAVSDIRDISKRTGAFSKTIKLPGTKNNNELLNQYYDVNVQAGTFDVNKLQHCILLEDNIPVVRNAYMQLVNVKKIQASLNEDESVEYEVVIKDNVGDFFTKLGGSELTDLDFSAYNHTLTASTITGSFANTQINGYKYLLPWRAAPVGNAPWYILNDFKPAIYALQYWDKIHAAAGFTYDWSTVSDLFVLFDQLIIPYNGDDKLINAQANDANRVKAERAPGSVDIVNPQSAQGIPVNWKQNLAIPVEIVDPLNLYSPSTSTYTVAAPYSAPNGIDFTFECEWELFFTNTNPATQSLLTAVGFRPTIYVVNAITGAVRGAAPLTPSFTPTFTPPGPPPPGSPAPQILLPGVNTVIPTTSTTVTCTVSNTYAGEPLRFRIGCQTTNGVVLINYSLQSAAVSSTIRVNTLKMSAALNTETVEYQSTIVVNNYIPKKIKQSDFIKSICQMYNLYVEIDPLDSQRLIYKHRDDFYDSGTLVDWTEKLDRGSEQKLQFIPELNKKRLILTYKADSDVFNQSYFTATDEVYGQQEVIFANAYIKDVDTKEILFSPTPMRPTTFGAIAPLIPGQNPSNNIRILIDNGALSCTPYTIQNYAATPNNLANWVTPGNYPFLSHLNSEYNPSFDINFGVCDFYFYNIINFTSSNLYNLFWKRTMAQMNNGKLLTALFYLSPADIQAMKLNDKIRIDNSYWNINKIIDYNANSKALTRVELLSIDDSLQLPRFGKLSSFENDYVINDIQDTALPPAPLHDVVAGSSMVTKSSNINSSVINSEYGLTLYGRGNVIGPEFTGVVVGDNRSINEPGYYVEDFSLTSTGLNITGFRVIDAGVDSNLPIDKSDPIDVIDGGLGYVREYGGFPRFNTTRVLIDGGADSV